MRIPTIQTVSLFICLNKVADVAAGNQIVEWEEVIPKDTKDPNLSIDDRKTKGSDRISLLSTQNSDDILKSRLCKVRAATQPILALRCQRWRLHSTWRRSADLRRELEELDLEFDDASKLVLIKARDKEYIGTWRLHDSLLSIEVTMGDKDLHLFGDLNRNNYGDYPKLERGVIVSNHRKWMRPVLGTFTGRGY